MVTSVLPPSLSQDLVETRELLEEVLEGKQRGGGAAEAVGAGADGPEGCPEGGGGRGTRRWST